MRHRHTLILITALALLVAFAPGASAVERQLQGDLPNLYISGWGSGYGCFPHPNYGGVSVTVSNTSSVPSPQFKVSIVVEEDGVGEPTFPFMRTLGYPHELPPFSYVELGPTGYHPMPLEEGGVYSETITVDPRDEIKESSETDNSVYGGFGGCP